MKCVQCDNVIPENSKFCPHCGHEAICREVPAQKEAGNARIFGILSIVSCVVGIAVLQIIFGPAGIILGTIAVNKKNKLGWIGIILGGIETILAGLVLLALTNDF